MVYQQQSVSFVNLFTDDKAVKVLTGEWVIKNWKVF